MPKILLVNKYDQELGYAEKIKVHKLGLLHRSFSIFIFNSRGKLLLQKRALDKYHSGGLWSNTCCSHQENPGILIQMANHRLKEEMGFTCKLEEVSSFIYKTAVGNGLIENELDHVFFGISDDKPKPNKREVTDYKYLALYKIKKDISKNPEKYTKWFKIILQIKTNSFL